VDRHQRPVELRGAGRIDDRPDFSQLGFNIRRHLRLCGQRRHQQQRAQRVLPDRGSVRHRSPCLTRPFYRMSRVRHLAQICVRP
jgi:hypothetical protein